MLAPSVGPVAKHEKYTRELLAEAVAASTSVAGVLRFLGLNQAGGTHAHISRRIKHHGLDTSHFVRFRNGAQKVRLTPDQLLVRRERGAARAKPPLLRRALLEIGRPYLCEGCGCDGTWQGGPLGLEIDHVDGDSTTTSATTCASSAPTAMPRPRTGAAAAGASTPGCQPRTRPLPRLPGPAGVVEQADTQHLGCCAPGRAGSTPAFGTGRRCRGLSPRPPPAAAGPPRARAGCRSCRRRTRGSGPCRPTRPRSAGTSGPSRRCGTGRRGRPG